MATVVFAPDSFKGTISAAAAARALAAGWARQRPGDRIALAPMADGGEGTLAAFEAAFPASRRVHVGVTGPDNTEVEAYWLMLPDGSGVVELASTSGIELLKGRLRPLSAHTRGFGQAIRAAVDGGAKRLLLGIGSSASTDGGVGLLRELGVSFLASDGTDLPDGVEGLAQLQRFDASSLLRLPETLVLSDVANPLLGPRGAAAVFGPQKGLDQAGRALAELGLTRLVAALGGDPEFPGSGAAGGVGYALRWAGAALAPGPQRLGEVLGLPGLVANCDAIVIGEGSYDAQSVRAKVPGYLVALADARGAERPEMLLAAGRIASDVDLSRFQAVESLTVLAGATREAEADPAHWLEVAGSLLARRFDQPLAERSGG